MVVKGRSSVPRFRFVPLCRHCRDITGVTGSANGERYLEGGIEGDEDV